MGLKFPANGDITGGLLSWTGENFRPFCFEGGGATDMAKQGAETAENQRSHVAE